MPKHLALLALLASLALPAAAAADVAQFQTTGTIIFDGEGPASVFPSEYTFVNDLAGPITDIDVTLNNLTHTKPDDLDMLLVSPKGTAVPLMSDACGTADVVDIDYRFSDDAAQSMLDNDACPEGTYLPGLFVAPGETETWPAAFPGPHTNSLAAFEGENPNVIPQAGWRLFMNDDAAGGSGDLSGAWTLHITYDEADVAIPGNASTSGVASEYPMGLSSDPNPELIVTDVDVEIPGLWHTHPADLQMLLTGPGGETVMLMDDACGGNDLENAQWLFDDEAPTAIPGAAPCTATTYRPADHGSASLPGAAPAGPYIADLSIFELEPFDDGFRLWINDTGGGDEGFILERPEVHVESRPAADTGFASATFDAAEVTLTRSAPGDLGEGSVDVVMPDGTTVTAAFNEGQASAKVAIPAPTGPAALTLGLAEAEGDVRIGASNEAIVRIPAPPVDAPGVGDDPAGGPAGGPGGGAPSGDGGLPVLLADHVAALTANKKCLRRRRRVRIKPREPRGVDFVRAVVRVNGRKVADRRGARADDVVRLRIRHKRTRVRMTMTAADGRTAIVRRTYRRCR